MNKALNITFSKKVFRPVKHLLLVPFGCIPSLPPVATIVPAHKNMIAIWSFHDSLKFESEFKFSIVWLVLYHKLKNVTSLWTLKCYNSSFRYASKSAKKYVSEAFRSLRLECEHDKQGMQELDGEHYQPVLVPKQRIWSGRCKQQPAADHRKPLSSIL